MLAPLTLPIDTRGGQRVNGQSDGYERSGELKKAVAHRGERLEITPQAPEENPPGSFSIREAIATAVTPGHPGTWEEKTVPSQVPAPAPTLKMTALDLGEEEWPLLKREGAHGCMH
jgi:hypothetical protein